MDDASDPFLGTEAVAAGRFTRRRLRSGNVAVYRNVYLPTGVPLTPAVRAKAAWLWSGRTATLAGMSASALHGARWIDPGLPAELVRLGDPVPGILIHRDTLAADEVCVISGMSTTSPARTAFDLGRRGDLVAAVARMDALANATALRREDVDVLLRRHRGARGIVQLRRALDLMDGGAESPPETRTRLLLIAAGFPRPQTQIVVDEHGYPFARLDMGWRDRLVGVEYDGAQHWTDPAQHARDIDRLARLDALGWRIVRVSRDMLRHRPQTFLARTRDAMNAAGWSDREIRLQARFAELRVA